MADFIFGGSKITADSNCSHEIKLHLLLGRKATTNLDSILKSRHHFANQHPYSQSYGFSRRHVWMWELDYKENWAPKNWCFWTVELEKTLESPLDCKEMGCWERLKAGEEGDDRGWDGWMASVTQWTWVWVNSGSWWWTGRPGVLQFMGSQRVGHDWMTELNRTEHAQKVQTPSGLEEEYLKANLWGRLQSVWLSSDCLVVW